MSDLAKQIAGLPRGAIFVSRNEDTDHPKHLALDLGRSDIDVKPLSWLSFDSVLGKRFPPVVVDDAAPKTWESQNALYYAWAHRLKDS